jgi:hypothetical protein
VNDSSSPWPECCGIPDRVTFQPLGYRDVMWCPYLNEPAILEWRKDKPHCPNCNGNFEPETHPFICHIQKRSPLEPTACVGAWHTPKITCAACGASLKQCPECRVIAGHMSDCSHLKAPSLDPVERKVSEWKGGPCKGIQSHDWKMFCQCCGCPYPGTVVDDPHAPSMTPLEVMAAHPFDHAAIMGNPDERRITMRFESQEQYEAALVFLDMADSADDPTLNNIAVKCSQCQFAGVASRWGGECPVCHARLVPAA